MHYSFTKKLLISEYNGLYKHAADKNKRNDKDQITEQLSLPKIPIVIATDSYSLYECLIKLGTTKEKKLMIDVIALRQSYERKEIAEIR
ncbi:polyprotein [Drepanopeziza brunnea f. sp. 'multigermtubi' MB_m1]|uniref:Polyprotein n=1 Tax=Marssonina brunnea f. sp. multigermtubi (strain MB_m1) TaxID=1072389 RepID=K1WLX8_MARBU|nr:polyprotein [Drepanopeziza brunnea f. sp. 'multigermtubi' MB_m1]EKD13312.1 polyprotein [Drepanopeziza brunnea f. sp. 'multigermtubi' MB_m1]